jgi:succinoglycan biosynthesis protein ExoA
LLMICFSRAGGPGWSDRWRFFLVLPTMHLSWGVGFIVGVVRGARDTVDTSRTGI